MTPEEAIVVLHEILNNHNHLWICKEEAKEKRMNKEITTEKTTEKTMTTKEVAEALGLKDNSSVTRIAKKCLPNKKIVNGKTTLWTEREAAEMLHYQQTQNNRKDLPSATSCGGLTTPSSTTKEVAEMLGVDVSTVQKNGKALFPNRVESRKTTLWTEAEVGMIAERIKNNHSASKATAEVTSAVTTVYTVPNLLAKVGQAATTIEQKMQIANAGMQALAEAMAMLKKENEQLKTDLDESEKYSSLLKYCDEHGLDTDRTCLASTAKKIRAEMRKAGREQEIKKIPDSRYPNGINSYPVDFLDVYFSKGAF